VWQATSEWLIGDGDAVAAERPAQGGGGDGEGGLQGLAGPEYPAGDGAGGVGQELRRLLARPGPDRDLPAFQQVGEGEAQVDLLLDRLLEADVLDPVDPQAVDVGEPAAGQGLLDCLRLHLEEAEAQLQDGVLAGFEQALGLLVERFRAAALGPALRGEDPELPAHLVLRRRGAVRVENVALVQHGVGDLAGGLEAHSATSGLPAAPASWSRAVSVSSQLVNARWDLYRASASNVSRSSLIQVLPGKCSPITSSHTLTGSR
jgi:hypothetical protein